MAVRNVFQGRVNREGIQIMQQRQVSMDEHQRPEEQFMHAMWDSKSLTNKNPALRVDRAHAIASADLLVKDRLHAAAVALKEHRMTEAYRALGDAIHTLQDATSPSHRGFQDWGTQSHKDHVMAERGYPGARTNERAELEGATRWALDIAEGKASTPEHFFDPASGLLQLPDQYRRNVTPPAP
jgi:hypothetical protein